MAETVDYLARALESDGGLAGESGTAGSLAGESRTAGSPAGVSVKGGSSVRAAGKEQ